ncbi:translocation/assembly module TamB domain-containing protein [Fusobacterium sp. THCT1E2]
MKEFYNNNKKKIITGLSLLLILAGGYWSVRYHLSKTVEVILQIALGPKISSSSIEFKRYGLIEIKDLKLINNKKTIIDAPKVELLYSKESLKKLRIEEIIIYDGIANITREKNGDINIVAAFTGESKEGKNDTEAEEKEYKPGIGVPIDRITAINATTNYTDLSYTNPIQETAYGTNGFLTFSKEKGINLIFKGKNKEQLYTFALNTSKEPYDINIKLENIAVKTELLQYAYDGDEVSYKGGVLNLDLSISPKGLFGNADFKDVTVRYKELDTDVKVSEGTVDFQGKTVIVKADYEVFDTKEKFLLVYADDELNIDFAAKNITYPQIQKYSLAKDINLPLENLIVNDVKFNLNLNSEKEFKVTIDFLSKDFVLNNLELRNINGKFIYDSKGIHIKDLSTDFSFWNKERKEELFKKKIALSLDYFEDEGALTFDINGNDSINNYIPNIDGVFNFETKNKNFNFNFLSNIIKLRGRYYSNIEKINLYRAGKFSLDYDLKNKNLERGSGVIDFNLYNLRFALDFIAENNKIMIDSLTAHDKNEDKITFNLTGETDISKMSYDLKFDAEELNVERNILNEDALLNASLNGHISGENGNINASVDIKSLTFKYLAEIKDIAGKFEFKKDEKIFGDFKGSIGQVRYNDYDLNGFIFAMRIKDDKFEIRDFRNGIVDINGNINLKNLASNINFSVKDLNFEKFNIEYPKFYINDIKGKISGKINDPKIDVKINDIKLDIGDEKKDILVHGEINYYKSLVKANKIYLNSNIFNGKYNLKNKKYNAVLNIIEDDPSEYYLDTNLKYRVIGTLKVDGEDKKINARLNSTIDKIYMRGTKLPNVYVEGRYKTDNISDGTIELNKIVLSNGDMKDILQLTAGYNLQTKEISAGIDNQVVKLDTLKEYTKEEIVNGNLIFNGKLSGKMEDLKYDLKINSNLISMKEINFKNFLIKINGNLDKVFLDEFSFKYLDNSFYSKGDVTLENKKYNFLVNSSKINLDFLNIFLEKYGITNIEGIAAFNLDLKDDGNSGYFNLMNFGMKSKEFFINMNNFNSTIKLDKKRLYIENFQGKLNDGDTILKGYLELPSITDIAENPYYMEDLDYDISLDTKGVNYKYSNYFRVMFDTKFNMKNNKLAGNINIIDGEVENIPSNSKSLFQIIKNFLFKSSSSIVNKSEDLGKDFQINTIFEKSLELDVTLKIDKGIKLDIQDVNIFVGDVEGIVVGGGRLSGKNGKFVFLGDAEIKNGSLAINGNTFELDKALVIFNDRKDYFPNVNPTLVIDSRVKVQNDELGMSINGELDALRFTITSKNGSASGNLSSLLIGDEEFSDSASATLFKTVIGSQLSQTIFRPVSNLIKNTLNISKFRIKSNILTSENQNPNAEDNRLRLGAVIEAEDNIYKDKLYWVARGTLLGDDNAENNNERNSGAFEEYDFSVEYRFKPGQSIGIGAGKLPRKAKTKADENSKNSINYHIDFKFEKKYDTLLDIFRKQ